MSEHTKKQFIAGLLLISCIISGWLLFITPTNDSRQLERLAQADSLLSLTLSDFNIPGKQISTHTIAIDSTFSRLVHRVDVPSGFSKTQFHAELQDRLSPYQISLPARVVFPSRHMEIQMSFKNTIIRSVKLQTDEELKMQRSFASLIISFEERPPETLLETLTSWGEPIPIAIIRNQPLTMPDWWDNLQQQYPSVILWLKTAEAGNLLETNRQGVLSALDPVKESQPSLTLLSFFEQGVPAPLRKEPSYSFIDAREAFIFNKEMDETEFNQTFRRFIREARSGTQPLAIIPGTKQMIKQTQRELNIFKKGGLILTPPSRIKY